MSEKFAAEPQVGEVDCLPRARELFYGGGWHAPLGAHYLDTVNPANGLCVASVAQAGKADTVAAIEAAHIAWLAWRNTPSTQRQAMLRTAAQRLRSHAREFAMIDAIDTGNPVAEMIGDAHFAADTLDYFAGLIPMLKGETIPVDGDSLHYSIREPLGVVARIIAYNHPLMFAAGKIAAPLAAGREIP